MKRWAWLFISLIPAISAPASGEADASCGFKNELSAEQRRVLALQFTQWKQSKSRSKSSETRYTVPIVFHLIESVPSISDDQVWELVASLNEVFSGSGDYADSYDTGIEFCLAGQAPGHGASDGITRIKSDYFRFDMDLETEDVVSLAQWDPRHYLNVWVVDEINGEALATYKGRTWWTRYGVGGFASAGTGVFVSSLSVLTLAHECGHYFGLRHTWEGPPCQNDDCLADGDMVCDTPPDKTTAGCPDNSCDTDTLSNYSNNTFFTDADDSHNIMDYSLCPEVFTRGQAERMHFHIENNYATLFAESGHNEVCETLCGKNLVTGFNIDNLHPLPNQPVALTSDTASQASYLEWYVVPRTGEWTNDTPVNQAVGSGDTLTYEFPSRGWYQIFLKAWNEPDTGCYAWYSRNILVSCGVDARFYPDKRVIASKQPNALMTDSVTFTNRSWGADEYEWTVRHVPFTPETEALPLAMSAEKDLVYRFPEPGEYQISLKAWAGECADFSGTFSLRVFDPTIDGEPDITGISCVTPDSLLVNLSVYNYGYDTVNVGMPVSFYSTDPQQASSSSQHLLTTYRLPQVVYGFDTTRFDVWVKKANPAMNQLYVVFNDTGTVQLPVHFPAADMNLLSHHSSFPPSGYAELTYDNNVRMFVIEELMPAEPDIVACEGEKIELMIESAPGPVTWVSEALGRLGNANPIDHTVLTDDIIYASWHTEAGCILADTLDITVSRPLVVLDATEYHIVKGESVRLGASGGVAYEWSPSAGLDDPLSPSPFASPDSTTIYTVVVTDGYGCTSTGEVTVFVKTTAWIPNLFTPNTDGANDFLRVYGLKDVQEIALQVFNRTGNRVYEASTVSELTTKGWDGNREGKSQPTGVYYWQVSGTYLSGKSILLNGAQAGVIHLVR